MTGQVLLEVVCKGCMRSGEDFLDGRQARLQAVHRSSCWRGEDGVEQKLEMEGADAQFMREARPWGKCNLEIYRQRNEREAFKTTVNYKTCA
mmetsp:Transcript_48883/g.119708  ORF Transcript_48883/g.119708 Transcript_48883/m.119708 type:complete len:92 (+) Transcript_48883:33-308(+)